MSNLLLIILFIKDEHAYSILMRRIFIHYFNNMVSQANIKSSMKRDYILLNIYRYCINCNVSRLG